MAQPATAVRVIYAKLTGTGDYDVVAKTDNIDLTAARSLAEKLLLGNVPHDANIGEEVASLRSPEGGHLVIRYTTYNWKDEHRGGAFMTDVVWLGDDDFARARNNPFAVLPVSDDVFESLTPLPPVQIGARSAADDFARLADIAQLASASGDALTTALLALAPPVLLGDPVLAIERGDRVRLMELFTLLLPPALRMELTFQTRAFRVPAFLPRITMSDQLHANLQSGGWKHVLPDVSLDAPATLSARLVNAMHSPSALRMAHELYDRVGRRNGSLREEATRVVQLVEFAKAVQAGDHAAALQLAVAGDEASIPVRVAAVLQASGPAAAHAAVLSSITSATGAEGDVLAVHLLGALADTDAAAAAELRRGVVAKLASAGRAPGGALAALLLRAFAKDDDADSMLLLLGMDARLAEAVTTAELPGTACGALLGAVSETLRSRRASPAVQHLLQSAAVVAPMVRQPSAAARLASICREAVDATLDRIRFSRDAAAELARLQLAAESFATAFAGSASGVRDPLPLLFTRRQLNDLARADAEAAGRTAAQQFSPDAAATMAAVLMLDAAEGSVNAEVAFIVARELLQPLPQTLRSQVQQVLEESGVSSDVLLGLAGGGALLPLLGRNAEQAASTRDIVQALRALRTDDAAIAQLAAAIVVARNSNLLVPPGHEAFPQLCAALADVHAERTADHANSGAVELALDLLATIMDAVAFQQLERAVLGHGGMTIRLRRLDRAVALCRAAEDETLYEELAIAIESKDAAISEAARRRLRAALGTGGLQRRVIEMITGVVERGSD
jgi:hypothetical protein